MITKEKLKSLYEQELKDYEFYSNYNLDSKSIETIQDHLNQCYHQCGRISMIEDMIKDYYGYATREFDVRKKKGTLFE